MEFDAALISVAEKLVAYCQANNEAKGLEELYAPDAVSVEALEMPGAGRDAVGIDAIRGKHDWWNSAFEAHETSAEGPFLCGDDRFAVIFSMDVTEKATGDRQKSQEVGIYTVKDGKIVREEFFYALS